MVSSNYDYKYFTWYASEDRDNSSELNGLLKDGWEPYEHVTPSSPSTGCENNFYSFGKRIVLVVLRKKK